MRAACARHLRDLDSGSARGLVWDVEAAQRALGFFPDVLRLNSGQFEGKPFELHPSQQFIVGSLFGWKRADGRRRFTRAFIEMGKGNGKSPLAAGIGLYGMMADGEPRSEVYAAASKKDQAMVLFRDAVAMVDQSPALAARITKSGVNPVWNLADLSTGSFFRPISSEDGQSGPRPHIALCDEVHEHPNGMVIEMLERGFKFRRQPLLVMITNAGSDKNSVCWGEHADAIKVASGEKDMDEFFAFVCSLDEDDDPLEDPSCWIKANPLLGVTITEDYLGRVARQAKELTGKMNNILRLHFCVWTGAERAWLPPEVIRAVVEDFDPEDHEGQAIWCGIDLAGTKDMTALACVVKTGEREVERQDGSRATLPAYDAWVECWTPKDTLRERALQDKADYVAWVSNGHLNETPGKIIRLDHVAARLAEIASLYRVEAVAYDNYAYARFAEEIDAFGLTLTQVQHPQGGRKRATDSGLWMPGSKSALETLIYERRIRIRNTAPIISAMNCAGWDEDPLGNSWFSKRKATQRIDALVALTMAVGAAEAHMGPQRSVYEDRGVLTLRL